MRKATSPPVVTSVAAGPDSSLLGHWKALSREEKVRELAKKGEQDQENDPDHEVSSKVAFASNIESAPESPCDEALQHFELLQRRQSRRTQRIVDQEGRSDQELQVPDEPGIVAVAIDERAERIYAATREHVRRQRNGGQGVGRQRLPQAGPGVAPGTRMVMLTPSCPVVPQQPIFVPLDPQQVQQKLGHALQQQRSPPCSPPKPLARQADALTKRSHRGSSRRRI